MRISNNNELVGKYPKLSIYRMSVLLILYILLFTVFSLQTIYYFKFQNKGWWLYFLCMTCAYLYSVFYCWAGKRHWVVLLGAMSFLIGYIPYEVVFPGILDLIVNTKPRFSELSVFLPSYLRAILDLLFYPSLVFILLLFVKKITLNPERQVSN